MNVIDNYGNPDCPHLINSNLLACERLKIYTSNEKSFSYNYGHTFEKTILDRDTLDIFKKVSHNQPTRIADRYEALLGVKNLTTDEGPYIYFEHSKDKTGDKFDNILYRHYDDGKTAYIKSYTNEDVMLMASECPNHPMLMLLAQTLEQFDGKAKTSTAKDSSQPAQPNL